MKNLLTKGVCLIAFGLIISNTILAQQRKYALVIGAQNYTALPPLRNSLTDAKDLTTALRTKGFQVETLLDPKNKSEIKDAIIRYKNAMEDVIGGVGIVFYAGHGMQFEGNNYIIPTTAKLELSSDLEDKCLKMNAVMSVLNATNKSLNILFLDACRTIPSFNRDSEQGWTKVAAPRGSIIVFATEAGKVASDGNGKNGLFTSKLLKRINEPGLNITDVLKRVKQDVFLESNEKQLPSLEDNSIGGDFFFTPGTPSTETVVQPTMKKEPVAKTPAGNAFDYGYGPVDAPVVRVGTQQWLGKNLNVDHFSNGDPIPEAKTDLEWKRAGEKRQPVWCYYKNDSLNGQTYGRLYNSYAVNDPRGLAPSGWHIPTEEEWAIMINYLGGHESAGLIMKSTNGWQRNGNGNNNSGISALPGGSRSPDGTFKDLGKYCHWWSSSAPTTGLAWSHYLLYSVNNVYTYKFNDNRCGFSVRCVKD
ncbi:MAG: caspase family protein [Cyclobacteriaceae bacterium]|nr:caspase family protein [Cyclobacteriaceae bacterium]